MKALRTKVILSGIVLVFAFIATIGTTFAWFTVSQTATVEEMQLSITAEDSLLIQVATYDQNTNAVTSTAPIAAAGYTSTLTNQNIIDAGYDDLLSYRLQPVTSIKTYYDGTDGSGDGEVDLLNLYRLAKPLTPDKDLVQTTAKNNAATGQFIELTFYLFYQGTGTADIILSDALISAITSSTSATVEDAIRLGMTLTDGSTTNSFIFGNTTDFGFTYESGDDGFVTPNGDSAFNNLFVRENPMLQALEGSLVAGVINSNKVIDLATATGGTPTTLFTMSPEVPVTVTVRIYVEGWAKNTVNEIINEDFEIKFGFAIKE